MAGLAGDAGGQKLCSETTIIAPGFADCTPISVFHGFIFHWKEGHWKEGHRKEGLATVSTI
jgi:hypothetical protein